MNKIERKCGYFQSNPNITTIYVGNLRYSKTEKDVKKLFEKFGTVKYSKLVLDDKTSKPKGIAFVQMPNKKQAITAIEKLNGSLLDGRTLKVSIAQERAPKTEYKKKAPSKKQETEETPVTARSSKRKRDKGLKVLFNYLNN